MKKYIVKLKAAPQITVEAHNFDVIYREPTNLVVQFFDVAGKASHLYVGVRLIEPTK
jgi:hypothetical protein